MAPLLIHLRMPSRVLFLTPARKADSSTIQLNIFRAGASGLGSRAWPWACARSGALARIVGGASGGLVGADGGGSVRRAGGLLGWRCWGDRIVAGRLSWATRHRRAGSALQGPRARLVWRGSRGGRVSQQAHVRRWVGQKSKAVRERCACRSGSRCGGRGRRGVAGPASHDLTMAAAQPASPKLGVT